MIKLDNAIKQSSFACSDEELKLIEAVWGEPVKKEDLFVLTLRVCDNDIDKDNECFSVSALYQIAEMIVGKRGIISNISVNEKNIVAQIYSAKVCCDYEKRTAIGQDYQYVEAKGFIIINDKSKAICKMIQDSEINAVSIGCSVKQHIEVHNANKVYIELRNVTDVYEWSFPWSPDLVKTEINYNEYRKSWNEGYKKAIQDCLNDLDSYLGSWRDTWDRKRKNNELS